MEQLHTKCCYLLGTKYEQKQKQCLVLESALTQMEENLQLLCKTYCIHFKVPVVGIFKCNVINVKVCIYLLVNRCEQDLLESSL